MTGTVSNVIPLKQYGFISGENGQEYFFHKEDTLGYWKEIVDKFSGAGNIRVSFDANKTAKGPRASNVKLLED